MAVRLCSLLILLPLTLAHPPAYPSGLPLNPSLPPDNAQTLYQLNNHGATNTTNPPPTLTAVPLDFKNSTIVEALKSGIAAGNRKRERNCTSSSTDVHASVNHTPGTHTIHASSILLEGVFVGATHTILASSQEPRTLAAVPSSAYGSSAAPASGGGKAIGRRSPQADGGSTQVSNVGAILLPCGIY